MSMPRPIAAGLRRGSIEAAQLFSTPKLAFSLLSTPVMFVVLAVAVDGPAGSPDRAMAAMLIAGGIVTMVVQSALLTLPQHLVTEREDGTLLRLRTVFGGLTAYLIGKTVLVVTGTVCGIVIIVLGGVTLTGVDLASRPFAWLELTALVVLGLAALTPLGALVGAILPNSREALGFYMLPVFALLLASGVYFPVDAMPGYVQALVQAFPLWWLTRGIDAALFGPSLATGQQAAMYGVVLAWLLLGFVAVPRVLALMTSRGKGRKSKAANERHSS